MTTRFLTRTFLICFVPFAALLGCSFWLIQESVQSTVRDGLRASLSENQRAIAHIHGKGNLQNSRFLKVAGDNPALKAGIELLLSNPDKDAARRTVEDQLRELGEHMGFDFLLVAAPSGAPLAGVMRQDVNGKSELVPMNTAVLDLHSASLLSLGSHTVQVASVPIDQSEANIGALSVGEYFDFSEFTTPAVLMHQGKVIESNIPNVPFDEINTALAKCKGPSECELRLRGDRWLSIPVQSFGGGYLLRSLEDVDKATAPIQSHLHNLFLTLAGVSVLCALLCSIISSRSIVKPIAALVEHLHDAGRTGVLPEFEGTLSSILEIRELAENYNRAAVSVRAAGEELEAAYLEFTGSLANALDARDQYTAGHSWRVSQMCCAIADALELTPEHQERIRIGALLHDIGKIGIADAVLQKPGRLTDEEFAIVKQHPVIGRRILEGVRGLAPFLGAVELHHENWNGTGYPKGQSGEQTPIDARIIHVSDAYDAMTTDRSYRRGMSHERAIEILKENAGIQFDPRIVEIFLNLPHEIFKAKTTADRSSEQVKQELAVAG